MDLSKYEKAKEKVRIAIIMFLRQTEKDVSKLFEQIDMVYANFNYPEDMEYFNYLSGMAGTEPRTFVKRANDIADFCKYYHGYDLKLYDMTMLSELAETKEFQEMPTYPQDGGMRYIDGALVIKVPDAK